MKSRVTTYILHSFILATAMMAVACMDGKWETPDMTNPPYGNNNIIETDTQLVTIDSLKQRYKTVISGSSTATSTSK